MDQTPIITSLINAGGFGVFAAAMFWLHVTSMRNFREELRLEREGFYQRNRAVVEAMEKQTGVLVNALDRVHEDLRRLEQTERRKDA